MRWIILLFHVRVFHFLHIYFFFNKNSDIKEVFDADSNKLNFRFTQKLFSLPSRGRKINKRQRNRESNYREVNFLNGISSSKDEDMNISCTPYLLFNILTLFHNVTRFYSIQFNAASVSIRFRIIVDE